jgi:hypothetical protein
LASWAKLESDVFKIYSASDKQKNYLKFELDGCLTVMLKFWKLWIEREGNNSSAALA